jgi:2-phosphosulfolactate phosphatase
MVPADFELRCEWGEQGLARLAPSSGLVILVDVLSFTTAVDIAVSRGATVFPYGPQHTGAEEFARRRSAEVARKIRIASGGYSLSPSSLTRIGAGRRIVLPSPNGSALSLATGLAPTIAGCLRNATAVARAAQEIGKSITVIAAGERWPDGSLRFALEDWLGAGAILAALPGRPSHEARAAIAAFHDARSRLLVVLNECPSGQELIERGFADDVALAAQYDVSTAVPRLRDGAY